MMEMAEESDGVLTFAHKHIKKAYLHVKLLVQNIN